MKYRMEVPDDWQVSRWRRGPRIFLSDDAKTPDEIRQFIARVQAEQIRQARLKKGEDTSAP
jgi:hypothetical protein